ncbi:hypothetical protein [Bilophila wadsworthia]|uniref:hypothetical protein n=1 Tax=Bilophila wadsworthia TaxID=35833 RepID=UPI003AAF2EBB
MPESVSIIVADGLVIVDGEALEAAYAYPEAVRAVQWRNGVGHVEFDDGRPNLEFMAEGDDVGDTYREYVLPGIRAFERERKRLDAEAEGQPKRSGLPSTMARRPAPNVCAPNGTQGWRPVHGSSNATATSSPAAGKRRSRTPDI